MTKTKIKTRSQKTCNINRLRYIRLLNKFLFATLSIVIIAFVININNLSIKAFVLRDLRIEASSLVRENEEIELMVMRLESYDHIAQRAQDLNMVRVETIDYIDLADTQVAKK